MIFPGAAAPAGATRIFVVHDRRGPVSCLLNFLWLVFGGGLATAAVYFIIGLVFSATICLLPFGVQLLKVSQVALQPFGTQVRTYVDPPPSTVVMNVLWLPIGVVILAFHTFWAVVCALTIVGLPFALAHMRIASLGLCPFGIVVDGAVEVYEVDSVRTQPVVVGYGTQAPGYAVRAEPVYEAMVVSESESEV